MIRMLAAWALYWLGCPLGELAHFGWPTYRAFNRLMIWSATVQGDERGPWNNGEVT